MSETKKKAWKSDSVDGALLFLLFHYEVFNPNSYSAVEIYDHPQLPFDCYSKKAFTGYCQTLANRSIKFSRLGTGLTKLFKEKIEEAKTTYSDLLHTVSDDFDPDDDFTAYAPQEDEDDLPFEADTEDDLSLGETIRNKQFEKPGKAEMPKATSASKTKTSSSAEKKKTTNSTPGTNSTECTKKFSITDPYLIPYPTKTRLFCQVPLGGNSEVDDDFKIEVTPWKTKVWEKVPKELEKAYDLLGPDLRLSLNEDACVHCTVLQPYIDERLAGLESKRDENKDLWLLEYELEHPFECLTHFFDHQGRQRDTFFIQGNGKGYYYCQFWLHAVPKNTAPPEKAKGVRIGKARPQTQQSYW
jgi:hypothetical protein